MKTLHLNLASKPFRDYRPVWIVAATVGIASLVLLIYNAQTAYRYFVNTETTRGEIERLQRETVAETQRARKIQNDVRRFDRKSINAQTKFINLQIAERAFSWSELLDQLERVVPQDVRLTNLNPSATPKGTTHLRMSCVAKSATGLVEMLRNLQADPHFVNPFPDSEDQLETGLHRFDVHTDYRPNPRGIVIP